MNMESGLLAIIPARGGSKGVPGKNLRPLAGMPLIAHTIAMAKLCPEITRCIVSTDSPDIGAVARRYGADLPFMRPPQLAQDDTPIWPVLRHALQTVEELERRRYEYLLLIDPTSPGRLPEDIAGALKRLQSSPEADGIVGVSRPEFNPIWTCVVERDGYMADLVPGGEYYTRRQDVPTVYRINAILYIWRAAFVRREANSWRVNVKNLLYEVPEYRAVHIDDPEQFERVDLLLRSGFLRFPWLTNADV